MHFDFAAFLVIAAVVTGTIWVLDIFVLAPRRMVAKTTGRKNNNATETPNTGTSEEIPSPQKAHQSNSAPAAKLPWYVDFSRSFFPVIVAVLLLRSFVVEPFRIPSGSMMPTLLAGDFILVNKFSFGIRLPVTNTKIIDSGSPQRGDVAVFRYPEDPSVAFIKRIVGLPGDELEYRGKRLYINGEPADETLLSADSEEAIQGFDLYREQLEENDHLIFKRKGSYSSQSLRYRVSEGHYFVLGDNRDNSRDSRFWGLLPEENLIGKAFFIWMNWDCILFRGQCDRIGRSIE